ncbi:MAG: ABC transporter substrate-binding protein [Bryobacteraceae bacterium]|nr:ABC transporter substrate-binding protein [Bryobacteraceae bacterium]MDW8379957.1 ABC transporter substrate-binding protein [Bryobacterales bacterium]
MNRRLAVCRLLCSACGLGLGCRRASTLRLLTFPESYGHHLSTGLGYYEQRRLVVEPQFFQAFPRMMEALLAGEGDVATAYYDALLPLVASGRDVVAFACLARRPGSVLAVSPQASRRIETIRDLRGCQVGIPGPGSSSHHLLNAILRRRGVALEEVKTVAIGVSASAVAAMEYGKVDAAMMTNLGLATLALKFPALTILADLRTERGSQEFLGHPIYPSLCLMALRRWLESNSGAARQLAQCFLAANRWMSDRQPEQIRAALPESVRAPDARADVEAIRGMLPTLDTVGRLDLAAASAVCRVVAQSVASVEPACLDPAKTFVDDYV